MLHSLGILEINVQSYKVYAKVTITLEKVTITSAKVTITL
jgi:hypothetical protein